MTMVCILVLTLAWRVGCLRQLEMLLVDEIHWLVLSNLYTCANTAFPMEEKSKGARKVLTRKQKGQDPTVIKLSDYIKSLFCPYSYIITWRSEVIRQEKTMLTLLITYRNAVRFSLGSNPPLYNIVAFLTTHFGN